MKNLSRTVRMTTLLLFTIFTVFGLVWAVGLSAQEATEVVEPVAEAAVETSTEAGDSVPGPTSQTLTMLVTVIVAPLITALLRRFNVANSLYQSINAIVSVGVFVAWWYLLGEQIGPVEDWIWRGLGVAAISGSVMSAAGKKEELKREFKAMGTGSGK